MFTYTVTLLTFYPLSNERRTTVSKDNKIKLNSFGNCLTATIKNFAQKT